MRRGPLTDQVMGNYVLGELIDEGGVGSVYTAEHRFLGDKAAVKILHPQPVQAHGEDIARRFFQEGRATRSIDHPNVVKILDLGKTEDGTLYLAMELLQGSSIATVLKSSPLDERSAAFIAAAVAGGLQAAHEKGIIHRDLKPANIFLCGSGQVRLLDFGMAKVKEGAMHTGMGLLVGTPQYMAPEQIRQEPDVGPRADVYGLGAVLFKMLTGRLPFESDQLLEIVKMHLGTPAPRPSQFAQVSEQMDAIVLACMEKAPSRRPASMSELREMLRPIAEQLGPRAAARLQSRRESVEVLPNADAALGLQELARSTRRETLERPIAPRRPPRRSSNWGATAVLVMLVVLAGLFVTLKLWSSAGWSATVSKGDQQQQPPSNLVAPPPVAPPGANPVSPAPVAPQVAPPGPTPNPAALPAPDAGTPMFHIESDPPGAQVFADHVPRGVTPLDLFAQPPVELKLTLDGYKTVRRKVTKAEPVKIRLSPVETESPSVDLPSLPPPSDPQ